MSTPRDVTLILAAVERALTELQHARYMLIKIDARETRLEPRLRKAKRPAKKTAKK